MSPLPDRPVGKPAGSADPDPIPEDAPGFAETPPTPYFAVIFTSLRTDTNVAAYAAMAARMDRLARARPGCLGLETVRDTAGFGITVSYWTDEAAILAWKADARHLVAQKLGRDAWYRAYHLRIARVERAYKGPEGR